MKSKRLRKRLLIMVEVLGLLMCIGEWMGHQVTFDNRIARQAAGTGAETKEFTVKSKHYQDTVTMEIQPKMWTTEEATALLRQAKKELENTYLGENASADNIYRNLHLATEYADGQVEAAWSLWPASYVDQDGTLLFDHISEMVEVTASVELRCGEKSEQLEYPLVLYPPTTDTEEGFHYELQRALQQAEEAHPQEDYVELPTKIGEESLQWTEKSEYSGIQLCLLGLLAAVAIRVAEKEEVLRAEKRKQARLERDYPNIVNWLSLYVGAGISVKQAFAMIGREASEDHPGYEAVLRCSRSIADGKSELAAFEDLSVYAPNKNYRKLSLLITHHLRKGSEDLTFQLEKEAQSAFEQRKMLARIAGEEASTKLLIPMMGLLGIIMVVLIIPALQGIHI